MAAGAAAQAGEKNGQAARCKRLIHAATTSSYQQQQQQQLLGLSLN